MVLSFRHLNSHTHALIITLSSQFLTTLSVSLHFLSPPSPRSSPSIQIVVSSSFGPRHPSPRHFMRPIIPLYFSFPRTKLSILSSFPPSTLTLIFNVKGRKVFKTGFISHECIRLLFYLLVGFCSCLTPAPSYPTCFPPTLLLPLVTLPAFLLPYSCPFLPYLQLSSYLTPAPSYPTSSFPPTLLLPLFTLPAFLLPYSCPLSPYLQLSSYLTPAPCHPTCFTPRTNSIPGLVLL